MPEWWQKQEWADNRQARELREREELARAYPELKAQRDALRDALKNLLTQDWVRLTGDPACGCGYCTAVRQARAALAAAEKE